MNVGKGWGGLIRPPAGNFVDAEDVNGEGGVG
jgi:hypothetical protein